MKVLSLTLADVITRQHHAILLQYESRLRELRGTFSSWLLKNGIRKETLTRPVLLELLNKIGAHYAVDGMAIEALPIDIMQKDVHSLIVDAIAFLHAEKRKVMDKVRGRTIRLPKCTEAAHIIELKSNGRIQVRVGHVEMGVSMTAPIRNQLHAIMREK
jgi:hypothetical protein